MEIKVLEGKVYTKSKNSYFLRRTVNLSESVDNATQPPRTKKLPL